MNGNEISWCQDALIKIYCIRSLFVNSSKREKKAGARMLNWLLEFTTFASFFYSVFVPFVMYELTNEKKTFANFSSMFINPNHFSN